MSESILVKLRGDSEFIRLRTVTRADKQIRRTVYLKRSHILRLEQECEVVENDSSSFVILRHSAGSDTLTAIVYLLQEYSDGFVKGIRQRMILPYRKAMDFVSSCTEKDVSRDCTFLSLSERNTPQIVFESRKHLKEVVSNRPLRRKLSKFLRDEFHWYHATEIRLYDDFVSYSFIFRELRGDVPGITGGVILHGQEDLTKAYYSIHT